MEKLLGQAEEGGLEEDDGKRASTTVVKKPGFGAGFVYVIGLI